MGFSRQEYWSGVPSPSIWAILILKKGFLIARLVKNPPAMQETQDRSLGWEDPLEKGTGIHSSILAWKIPRIEEPGRLQSTGS